MSRIVVAPDSFKGTLGAGDVAVAIADGWRSVCRDAELELLPMADGGEGTLRAFAVAVPGARRMPVRVTGPTGEPVDAAWLLLPGNMGVVELAGTCGIELLDGSLAPWDAHTTGLGDAIRAALDHGVDSLVLGIGSSASTDGGVGMLRALGWRFLDSRGDDIAPGARGLLDLCAVDDSGGLTAPADGVRVLSDVTNPLIGRLGAASVFGPQKGLLPDAVASVDEALGRLATLLGTDSETPGAGAAGGTGAALLAWGAALVSGAREVAGIVGLAAAVEGAALVVTGEGAFDAQSLQGKAPGVVAQYAQEAGVAVALVAGQVAAEADCDAFVTVVSLSELAGSREAAMRETHRWLRAAGAHLARTLTSS